MLKSITKKYPKGAASFYVVAFSTLVLVIIATSFAVVIMNEITRSSNDDLSQSAYDSALAGVEDAKMALYNYQSCVDQGAAPSASKPTGTGRLTCSEIMWYMDHPDCDMVGHILGRYGKDETGEEGVLIEESGDGTNVMQQFYTCATIKTVLEDYRSTMTEETPTRVVRVNLASVAARDIKSVRISWYSGTDGSDYVFNNAVTSGLTKRVQFPTLREERAATPPTISFGIVQTAEIFNLSDFDRVTDTASNRGMIYLVPSNDSGLASGRKDDNYIGAYKNDKHDNVVTKSQFIKSNDRTVKNLPFAVYCDANNEFACSALIELPDVIDGDRNEDTFMVVVSIPYGQPSTDFSLAFYCNDGVYCGTMSAGGTETTTTQANLKGVQVTVDVTGRANNLYRRVEARLDTADSYFPYPLYALELLGRSSDTLLSKRMTVTSENSAGLYDSNLLMLYSH